MRAPDGRSATEAGLDEDIALMRGLARGDRAALAALYDRYAGLLLAVGVRVLGDRREAEDLLHDVFMEAWQKAKTYDPERGTVRGWLAMRMRSRALDRVRAAGRAKVVLSADGEAQERPAEGVDPSLEPDRRVVRVALAGLADEQRAVLELAYFGGLTCSEISLRLGVPIGTVKSRMARALGHLRRALEPAPEGTP